MPKDYCIIHDTFGCNCGIDEHGQPRNRGFSITRLEARTIDELIGLCKGIQADSAIHPDEVAFLIKWLEYSRHIIDVWPANILAERIRRMLEDGAVDKNEHEELLELLREIYRMQAWKNGH